MKIFKLIFIFLGIYEFNTLCMHDNCPNNTDSKKNNLSTTTKLQKILNTFMHLKNEIKKDPKDSFWQIAQTTSSINELHDILDESSLNKEHYKFALGRLQAYYLKLIHRKDYCDTLLTASQAINVSRLKTAFCDAGKCNLLALDHAIFVTKKFLN